jgi:hypothetical protein
MPIQPTPKIWMNGELVDWENARIHVLTHTLHYGRANELIETEAQRVSPTRFCVRAEEATKVVDFAIPEVWSEVSKARAGRFDRRRKSQLSR